MCTVHTYMHVEIFQHIANKFPCNKVRLKRKSFSFLFTLLDHMGLKMWCLRANSWKWSPRSLETILTSNPSRSSGLEEDIPYKRSLVGFFRGLGTHSHSQCCLAPNSRALVRVSFLVLNEPSTTKEKNLHLDCCQPHVVKPWNSNRGPADVGDLFPLHALEMLELITRCILLVKAEVNGSTIALPHRIMVRSTMGLSKSSCLSTAFSTSMTEKEWFRMVKYAFVTKSSDLSWCLFPFELG